MRLREQMLRSSGDDNFRRRVPVFERGKNAGCGVVVVVSVFVVSWICGVICGEENAAVVS